MSADVPSSDFSMAMKRINEFKAENSNLKCQIRILEKKNEDLLMQTRLQMSKIVEYRRLIEHYEDGAPLYVSTAN